MKREVKFMGIDPLHLTDGAARPMLRDSWRFAFTEVDGVLHFGLSDSGPLVVYEASDWSEAEMRAFYAQGYAAGAAAEREACAVVCESMRFRSDKPSHTPDDCAAAIRARGET